MRHLALLLLFLLAWEPTFAKEKKEPAGPHEVYVSGSRSLSPQDKEILSSGKYDSSTQTWSAIFSIIPGFGLGHAIQGRYQSKGWIFTVVEAVGLGSFAGTWGSCHHRSDDESCSVVNLAGIAGLVLYSGAHIWEVVDAIKYPRDYNANYEAVKKSSSQITIPALDFVFNF